MFLFGDDLPNVLKEAKESSNIQQFLNQNHSKTYKRPSWSGKLKKPTEGFSVGRGGGGGGGSKRPLTHRHTKRKAKETISREEMICKLKQIKEELNMSKLCRYFWSILITHAKYLRLDR